MIEQNKHIYIICGSGGVGKTTTAAALGLSLAGGGKKVLVLTIDPARRLATALGLTSLSDDPQLIKTDFSGASCGELWAMRLNTKRTFDRLVDKYASSRETRDRIFHNKLYQHLSKMLAGTQEYMAMEKLYEIDKQAVYDVIVVDTPPMQNAVDFLAAPLKMMNVINNSLLHLLIKPAMSLGKTGFKLLGKGSRPILKIFDRITGFAFMQDLSEMLIAFQDLLTGFESRAVEVDALLQRESSAFILVGTTGQSSVDEMKKFFAQLTERGYHLKSVIVNRVYEGEVLSQYKMKQVKAVLSDLGGAPAARILVDNYRRFIPLIKNDAAQIAVLREGVAPRRVISIPLFYTDVHDLEGLSKISQFFHFDSTADNSQNEKV